MPGASEAAPVSTASLRVFAGAYRDSLLLLSATRAMMAGDGVEWATAVMALSANVADLAADGFAMTDLDGADANDLVLAVRAADAATASAALDCGARSCSPSLARLTGTGHGRPRGPLLVPWRSCRLRMSPWCPFPDPTPAWRRTRPSLPGFMSCYSATTCRWRRR